MYLRLFVDLTGTSHAVTLSNLNSLSRQSECSRKPFLPFMPPLSLPPAAAKNYSQLPFFRFYKPVLSVASKREKKSSSGTATHLNFTSTYY